MGVNSELIQEARKALMPGQVFLRSSEIGMSDDIHLFESGQIQYQSFKQVQEAEEHESADGDGSIFSFYYAVGVRAIPKNEAEEEDPEVLFEMKALYCANYKCENRDELSDEALDEFAQSNVGFHVWPFWREYVQSTCMRMGIAPITVGFYKP